MMRITLCLTAVLTGLGCGGPPPAAAPEPAAPPPAAEPMPEPASEPEPAAEPVAEPVPEPIEIAIEGRSGSKLTGKARFEQVAGGVKVLVSIEKAPPGSLASHVHETGDCSAKDGKSAGGHFNPAGHDHGLPPAEKRHLGDLGNIEVDKAGNGSLEIVIEGASLVPDAEKSFLGRSIIVHAKKDDGGQPTGNAGGRIGCGVIAR